MTLEKANELIRDHELEEHQETNPGSKLTSAFKS